MQRAWTITREGNRKIGLGVMGFADALIKMGIPYNSEQALEIAEQIIKSINVMEGTRLLEINPIFEQAARERGFFSADLMEKIAQSGTLQGVDGIPEDIKRVFVTDWDITPEWHVRMQSVFQRYTDNSVSKTINLPAESTPDDIRKVYVMAHELKCKGITIYRYGSKKNQVLTLAGQRPKEEIEASIYMTADSEYSGGCPTGTCPFQALPFIT